LHEQIGREAAALLEVERERAKQRQADQAKENQPQAKKPSQNRKPVSGSEKGKASEAVGK
jgi:hypothetical protein